MQSHDLFAQAQFDARTGCFGSKERNENLIQNIRQNSLTIIRYCECWVAFRKELYLNVFICFPLARFAGVFLQVDKHFLYLCPVCI